MPSRTRAVFIVCAALLAAAPSSAQTQTQVKLSCEQGEPCSVATDGDRATLRVKVDSGGTPAPLVHFSTTQGSVVTPVRPVNGVAETTWRGATSKSAPVVVTAWVESAVPSDPLQMKVLALGAPPSGYDLAFRGSPQVWYTGRMLPDPVSVWVTNTRTEQECEGVSVAFKQFGEGLVGPDTVRASYDDKNKECLAWTRWRLSGNVGKQEMMARIVGASAAPVRHTATARQLPRLAFGVLGTRLTDEYDVLLKSADTVVVVTESVDPATGVKTVRTIREVADSSRLEEKTGDWDGGVAFGIDFPIKPSWTKIRTFVGVSAADPTEVFYLGFSPLQAFHYGLPMEAIGIDLFMGMRWTNKHVGKSTGCEDGVRVCEERDFRMDGLFAGAVVDGTQLVSNVLKAFVPGL